MLPLSRGCGGGRDGDSDSFLQHLGQNSPSPEAGRFSAELPHPTCQSPHFLLIAKAGRFAAQLPACMETGVRDAFLNQGSKLRFS